MRSKITLLALPLAAVAGWALVAAAVPEAGPAAATSPDAPTVSPTIETGEVLLVRVPGLRSAADGGAYLRPVDADGSVTLPGGVSLVAAGKTEEQVSADLAKGLADAGIFKPGTVSVSVSRWQTRAESPFGAAPVAAMQFLEVTPAEGMGARSFVRVAADGRVLLPDAPRPLAAAGKSVGEIERAYAAELKAAGVIAPATTDAPLLRRITRDEAEKMLAAER